MAKPNYRQQKRQKELARKSRQDEKLAKRTPRVEPSAEGGRPDGAPAEATAAEATAVEGAAVAGGHAGPGPS